jgi:hypothetical protein
MRLVDIEIQIVVAIAFVEQGELEVHFAVCCQEVRSHDVRAVPCYDTEMRPHQAAPVRGRHKQRNKNTI